MTRIDRIIKRAEQIIILQKRIAILPKHSRKRTALEAILKPLVTCQLQDQYKIEKATRAA